MDQNAPEGSRKRGSVATAAIIVLLVAVVGIGIADYYLGSSRTVTETSVTTATTSFPSTITKLETETNVIYSNSTTTAYKVSTATSISTSTVEVTPSTTLTIVQTTGNISQITVSEGILYAGQAATGSSAATSSLLIGFYNPNSTTYITSLVLESANFAPIIAWDNSSSPSSSDNTVSFSSMQFGNTLSYGLTSVFTFYPSSSSPINIVHGQSYQYVVFFANGSYVEGALVAQ